MTRRNGNDIDEQMDPLFALPAPGGGDQVGETTGRAAPRSVAQASCPSCVSGGRGDLNFVGLQRAGEHLVWREHHITTWSGARTPCPASGVAVCELRPKQRTPGATCQHDRPPWSRS